MPQTETIPDLPGFDSTAAFLQEGYGFVSHRCRELKSVGLRTRLMLRPVTCLRGVAAAREFYRPGQMTRRGAMTATVVPLLRNKGSVQALDDSAHQVRKAVFLDLMTPERLTQARRILAEEWAVAARGWQGRTVTLRDEIHGVMTRIALRWCGIAPEGQDVAARAEERPARIGVAGGVGPARQRLPALAARRHADLGGTGPRRRPRLTGRGAALRLPGGC